MKVNEYASGGGVDADAAAAPPSTADPETLSPGVGEPTRPEVYSGFKLLPWRSLSQSREGASGERISAPSDPPEEEDTSGPSSTGG